ncbi:Protein-tyrosine phosphatase-like [Trinorchestia longiramus]|nr:Protein-tyrosine phosphatase-like [Trinorchestia longiramus]
MRKGRVPLRTVLQNFIDHVDNIENQRIDGEDLYEKEFQELKAITESLKSEPGFECSHGEKEENRRKNRYKDILPWLKFTCTRELQERENWQASPSVTQRVAVQVTQRVAVQVTQRVAVQVTQRVAVQVTQRVAVQVTQRVAVQVTQRVAVQVTQPVNHGPACLHHPSIAGHAACKARACLPTPP